MRTPGLLLLLGITGCAFTRGAAIPGGACVERVPDLGRAGDGALPDHPRWSWGAGAKIGVASGRFGDRPRSLGLGPAGLHLDLVYFPRAGHDQLAVSGTVAYHAESIYDGPDQIGFSGFSPEAAIHYGLVRRLSVHAGAGVGFGDLALTAGDDPEVTASATEAHAFAGLTVVFRRTPLIDISLRVEGGVFTTTEATLAGDTGSLTGEGVMFEGIFSSFPGSSGGTPVCRQD